MAVTAVVSLLAVGCPPAMELKRQEDLLKARALHDRAPIPPPFPAGSSLRYVGPDVAGAAGEWTSGVLLGRLAPLAHGAVVHVGHVCRGHRGTLQQYVDADGKRLWWDDAHRFPMLDVTTDGYSAIGVGGKTLWGWYVTEKTRQFWELVP